MAGSLTRNPLLPPQLNELLKGPNKAAATEPKITWELEQMAPPPHLIPAHPSPPSTHLQGHRGRQALGTVDRPRGGQRSQCSGCPQSPVNNAEVDISAFRFAGMC